MVVLNLANLCKKLLCSKCVLVLKNVNNQNCSLTISLIYYKPVSLTE